MLRISNLRPVVISEPEALDEVGVFQQVIITTEIEGPGVATLRRDVGCIVLSEIDILEGDGGTGRCTSIVH